MRHSPQDKFRRRVKRWLCDNEISVTELARRIGRRRDTVSTAIHQARFPRVVERIEEELAK